MAFDLGALLKDVSESDTGRDQIQYIPLDQIDEDPNNFYQLTDIPNLADNISLCGLQQPIRVRQKEDGRYIIVSGHRRRAALEMLVADGYEKWKEAPCIVEQDEVSPTLQQLRLIYANANTRVLTSAEQGEQAEQVTKLLYQLKEEGFDFPGRMRDHVAEAMNVSKTKLARLKVIREKLAECWKPAYHDDIIKESTAYALAQLPEEWQHIIYKVHDGRLQYVYQNTVENAARRMGYIVDLKCDHGCAQGCQNMTAMLERNVKEPYRYCTKCCFDCDCLQTCKSSCFMAASQKKELRDTAKAASREAAERQAERERPYTDLAREIYERVGKVRTANQVSVEDLYNAQGKIYGIADDEKQLKFESGQVKFHANTPLPFGYSFYPADAKALCAVADLLHCSIDYLMGREEKVSNPDTRPDTKEKVSNSDTTWNTEDPEDADDYLLIIKDPYNTNLKYENWYWDGKAWSSEGYGPFYPDIDGEIVGWVPLPKSPDEKSESALNDSCITGMSLSGHCGAAACCSTEYSCCLQCPETCNSRCGWIDDVAEEV